MRVIIRAVPERERYHVYLRDRLPEAEWVMDDNVKRGPTPFTRGLARAFELAGGEGALHLEDDVILTRDFLAKAETVVSERPDDLVQLFSVRQDQGWVPGSKFQWTQCFWVPEVLAAELDSFYASVLREATFLNSKHGQVWRNGRRVDQDFGIAEFLRVRGLRYFVHVPSLVQHRAEESIVGHAVGTQRGDGSGLSVWQSATFEEPDDDLA